MVSPNTSNKGAISVHTITLIWRIIYLAIVFGGIVWLVNSHIIKKTDTTALESELFVQRLIRTPPICSYDGLTERVLPGVVDFQSFSSEDAATMLDRSLRPGARIAARVTLFDSSGNSLGKLYSQQQLFERWRVLAASGATGAGGATMHPRRVPVVISTNYTVSRAVLLAKRQIYSEDSSLRSQVASIDAALQSLESRRADQSMAIGSLLFEVVMPNS